MSFNPNTFTGVVEKVWKNYLPKEEEKGGRRKRAHAVCPRGPGLEPRTYCVLGEGPQLHATGVVWTRKPFRGYRYGRAIALHDVRRVLEICSVRFVTVRVNKTRITVGVPTPLWANINQVFNTFHCFALLLTSSCNRTEHRLSPTKVYGIWEANSSTLAWRSKYGLLPALHRSTSAVKNHSGRLTNFLCPLSILMFSFRLKSFSPLSWPRAVSILCWSNGIIMSCFVKIWPLYYLGVMTGLKFLQDDEKRLMSTQDVYFKFGKYFRSHASDQGELMLKW